jgi:hypothetical protein
MNDMSVQSVYTSERWFEPANDFFDILSDSSFELVFKLERQGTHEKEADDGDNTGQHQPVCKRY